MHSISITAQERRRRAQAKEKQIRLNIRLLTSCGFEITEYKPNWMLAAGPMIVAFNVETAEFRSLADVVEASYKQGRHNVQTDMKRALGII